MTQVTTRQIIALLLLLPVTVLLFVVLVVPSIWALVLSFHEYSLTDARVFIGLDNFLTIFSDRSDFVATTGRTFLFVVLAVGGEFLLGMAFSLLLARGFPGQRFWVALYIAPFALSPVVAVVVWKYLFNTDYGLINYGLSLMNVAGPNWFSNAVASFAAIVIIDIWRYTPFTILILYPSITSISQTLYDAARIDGAGFWQSFRRITFPLITPAAATALTFRIIFGLRLFGPIYLFNGGGPVSATKVLSILLYEEGIVYWHFGLGSAVAVMLLIVTLLLAAPQIKAMQQAMFRS